MKHIKFYILTAMAAAALITSCSEGRQLTKAGLDPAKFDSTINGKPVRLYTLKNANGMEADITNFGGRIVSLLVPDKQGQLTDVVLGYDNLAQYADSVNSPSDFGAAIGRYANRIGNGQITVDGRVIQLPRNNGKHTLHGGPSGWQYQVYDATQLNDSTLQLVMNSPDGDNNFPGAVVATVTYTLLGNNTLDIRYEATTDAPTVINMTNHSYFNLTGDLSKEGTSQVLYINADSYTPADDTFMTTGEIAPVEGTPMDFRKPHAISETINDSSFLAIKNALGYDNNWCLNTYKDGHGDFTQVAASLYSPETGIFLEMFTDEPGVQVYTGNFLAGKVRGKKGIVYPHRCSVCLESQKYPDSPNKPQWPSPYLRPGEKYESHTAYRFSVK